MPITSPLRTLPNALLTPHNVSHTRQSLEALPKLLLANIEAILAGRMPPSPCNPQIAGAWTTRWSA